MNKDEPYYQPLSFAREFNMDGFKHILDRALRGVPATPHLASLRAEMDKPSPNKMIKMAYDDTFLTEQYSGPYPDLNWYLTHVPRCRNFFTYKDDVLAEWRDVISMSALMELWRQNKQIYIFDSDFANALSKTKKLVLYPSLLRHLPYDTFYIDFKGIASCEPFDGMFVHVELYENDTMMILGHRLVDDTFYSTAFKFRPSGYVGNSNIPYVKCSKKDFTSRSLYLPLSDYTQKVEGYNTIISNKNSSDIWMFALQFLMYLCSDKPDITENPETKATYHPSARIKDRYAEIRKWDVGVRYGNKIRMFNKTEPHEGNKSYPSGRKPPRPHSRCAHWQRFHTGHGRTEITVKWIEPTFVGAHSEEDPAVIRYVTE